MGSSLQMRLDGRVALVTGAGHPGGIGGACARALAAAGGRVAIADLPGTRMDEVAASLPASAEASTHEVDVGDQASIASLIESVVARHGRLDGLVHAPAILETRPFLELEAESWDRTMHINTRGAFLTAQAAARQMMAQGEGGRIVLVASNVGRTPRINNTSYACSKAAVIHLVRCIAMELGRHGITANALCPGSTATTMLVDVQAGGDPSRLEGIVKGSLEQWRTGIPLGHLAEPEDQAAMAAFLLSDAGRYLNGQALCVDGGQTLF